MDREPPASLPVPVGTVRAAQAGDRSAWRELFNAYQPALTSYCCVCARGRRELALDWTQDIFALAIERLSQLREPERFTGWLFTLARNHCLKHARQSEQERRLSDALSLVLCDGFVPSIAEAAEREAWLLAVQRSCSSVEHEGHRAVIEAHYLRGEKTRDIAERTGTPHGTVTVTLMRFRNRLKLQLLSALAKGELP
jgi:RNA polymerase sigma factor (sigma-70 family)